MMRFVFQYSTKPQAKVNGVLVTLEALMGEIAARTLKRKFASRSVIRLTEVAISVHFGLIKPVKTPLPPPHHCRIASAWATLNQKTVRLFRIRLVSCTQ